MSLWLAPPPRLFLGPGELHIWRIALDRTTLPTASLSAEELERASRFHFPQDRERFLASHASLRFILASYLDAVPESLVFRCTPRGKPELAANDSLRFNLSHSGMWALAGLFQGANVGVDVEVFRANRDIEAISARFFAPEEQALLRALPEDERTRAFFCCWTRKEAYVKGAGGGLSIPLDSFAVSLEAADARFLRGAAGWTLLHLDPDPGCAAAAAVESPVSRVCCWDFSAVQQPHQPARPE